MHDALDPTDGSSPLARGTLPFRPRAQPEWRFIPAGAGNAFTSEPLKTL